MYFRFFPLHISFYNIGLEDINRFDVQTYKAIRDYGGRGSLLVTMNDIQGHSGREDNEFAQAIRG